MHFLLTVLFLYSYIMLAASTGVRSSFTSAGSSLHLPDANSYGFINCLVEDPEEKRIENNQQLQCIPQTWMSSQEPVYTCYLYELPHVSAYLTSASRRESNISVPCHLLYRQLLI